MALKCRIWCFVCRRSVQFSAAFLPGSSRDFRVTPSSGFLPPVGSAGKLITVAFTPTSANSKHRARLTIQVFTGFIIWSSRLCFDQLLDSYLYGVDHNMPLLYISHGHGSFHWVLACLCSRQYWCSGPSRWKGQSYSLHPSISHRTMATPTPKSTFLALIALVETLSHRYYRCRATMSRSSWKDAIVHQ